MLVNMRDMLAKAAAEGYGVGNFDVFNTELIKGVMEAAKECSALHRDWVHYSDEGSSKLADEIIEFLEKENLL